MCIVRPDVRKRNSARASILIMHAVPQCASYSASGMWCLVVPSHLEREADLEAVDRRRELRRHAVLRECCTRRHCALEAVLARRRLGERLQLRLVRPAFGRNFAISAAPRAFAAFFPISGPRVEIQLYESPTCAVVHLLVHIY